MAPSTRILVVADDPTVGRWLRHRIEALELAGDIEVEDRAAHVRRAAGSLAGIDVVAAALDFAPAAAPASLAFIRRASQPGRPPLLVVADNGDELAAVGALRHGARDYLPRHLLTTPMLATSLDGARATSRDASTPRAGAQTGAPPLPRRMPRDLVPRYMLLDTLGESARATVYLAHSEALDRSVALKVSRGGDDGEPQFAREYAAVGVLRHPSVVDIYDYGVHDGREFMAMEYFPCGDLKARLQNPVSEGECLEYLERIARALAVVHGQGLVHRDLKPPNIMLREGGEIVLIDFGISKDLGQSANSTRTGVLRGSPYYMSPEQAQGEALDARSDLYSLGVIFYEMLTGTKPYVASTAMEVLQLHVDLAVPELPAPYARHQPLLDGLMAKDRNRRIQSADALLESLRREAA